MIALPVLLTQAEERRQSSEKDPGMGCRIGFGTGGTRRRVLRLSARLKDITVRLIVRVRPSEFIGPTRVLNYDKSDSGTGLTLGKNSMIQTLDLGQNVRKMEIESAVQAGTEVAASDGSAPEHRRLRSPRKVLNIQTMAFVQDREETGVVSPPPTESEFAEDVDNTAESEGISSAGGSLAVSGVSDGESQD